MSSVVRARVAEIAEFAKIQQVTIGSPSLSHSLMPNRTKEELRNEINDSKRDLEQWIGRPVRVFSSPTGSFDNRVGPLLAEAGIRSGLRLKPNPLTLGDDRYCIPRFSVMDDGRMLSENVFHAFGLWQRVMEVLEVSKLIRRNADSDRIEHAHFTA